MTDSLPQDPPLHDAPALERALREALRRLAAGEVAPIPHSSALPALWLGRWLYRHWLDRQPSWRPLVHLDAGLAARDTGCVQDALQQAAGGWLLLDGLDRCEPPGDLLREARRRGIGVLLASPAPELAVPDPILRRLQFLDRHHLVATDPGLADLRRSLLSHCRSHSPVHLTGPPGTGKVALANWAHASLDHRPMSHIRRGGTRRPVPGQWELYEEVADLDPDQLHALRIRLQSPEDLPAPAVDPELDNEVPARPDHPAFQAIRGESSSLVRVLAQSLRAARLSLSVLILGESGVGKEALARAIHESSGRAGPYRVADVSTLNEELVESELFGHTAGAFTGAHRERLGAIRAADRGTLFLDELGNLPPRIQVKLLRFLQEKTVQPVGSDRVHSVDVRVVAATHADLQGMVHRGEFREDLLRRLDAVTLRLPPLRERPEDVLPLARFFLARALGVDPAGVALAADAADALRAHAWPGNIRELENVMGQAAAESEGGPVHARHLGPLAPRNRRPVPVLTTTSDDSTALGGLPLERHVLQRMTAVTLRVPALRDRGPRSIRNAILSQVDGRPVRGDALQVLEGRPWWGNLTEVEADLAALRANVAGVVDREALRRVLPHLLREGGAKPIRVLMDPVLEADGSVSGMRQEFAEAALLVGRVMDMQSLQRSAAADPRLLARVQAVRSLAGGAPVSCLSLTHLHRLGRAHLLVTRGEDGLRVHCLPGASLPLVAGPLSPGVVPRPVAPDRPVDVGMAGELRVHPEGGGAAYLQLFVFAGRVAEDERAGVAAERARGLASGPVPTLLAETGDASGEAADRRPGIWSLEPREREILNAIVLRYRGGDFKAHLEEELEPRAGEAAAGRLARYLAVSRPTQYCARLYSNRLNAALREELCAALVDSGDPVGRLRRLPASIAQEVESRVLELAAEG